MTISFDEVITTRERFREIVGAEAGDWVTNKVIDHVDRICADFIAQTLLSSSQRAARMALLIYPPKATPLDL